MIKVTIIKKDNVIDKLTIKGHANYDVYGNDIVCAAVSATIISNINGILSLDSNYLNHSYQDHELRVVINKHDDIVDTLISNVISCLNDLSKQYPSNLKIMMKEE